MPSNAPTAPTVSVSDELRRLAALRDDGVLTADEFENQKTTLLAGTGDRVAGTIEREAERSRFMAFVVIALVVGVLIIWGALSTGEKSRQDGRDQVRETRNETYP